MHRSEIKYAKSIWTCHTIASPIESGQLHWPSINALRWPRENSTSSFCVNNRRVCPTNYQYHWLIHRRDVLWPKCINLCAAFCSLPLCLFAQLLIFNVFFLIISPFHIWMWYKWTQINIKYRERQKSAEHEWIACRWRTSNGTKGTI